VGTAVDANDQPTSAVTVRIDRYLKGFGPETVTVNDPGSQGACAFFSGPIVGQRFLFLFHEATEPFQAMICNGSGQLTAEYEGSVLSQIEMLLQASGLPNGGGPPTGRSGQQPLIAWALLVLGPLPVLAAAAFLWRRG
jgi:hypothetical protein